MADKVKEICDPDSGVLIILATALERDVVGHSLDSLLLFPSKESLIADVKENSFKKSFWNKEIKDRNDEKWFGKVDGVLNCYSTQYDEFIARYTKTEIRMMYTMRERCGDDECLKLFDVENIESYISPEYTEEGIKNGPPPRQFKQKKARAAFLARLKPQRERQLELAKTVVQLCNMTRNFRRMAEEKTQELNAIYAKDTIDIKDKLLKDSNPKKLSEKAPKLSFDKGIALEKRRQRSHSAPSRVNVLTQELNALGIQKFDCAPTPRAPPPELYFSLDDADEYAEWQSIQRQDNADMPEIDPMEIAAFADMKELMKKLLEAKDYDPKKIPATMFHLLREEILEASGSDDDLEYESESEEEAPPMRMRFPDPPKPDKKLDIGLLEIDFDEIDNASDSSRPEGQEYSNEARMEDDSEAQIAIDDSTLFTTSSYAPVDVMAGSPDSRYVNKPPGSKPSRQKARILTESPPPQPRERDLTPPPKRPRTPVLMAEQGGEEDLTLQRKKPKRKEKIATVQKAKKKLIPEAKIKKEKLDSIDFVVPHCAESAPAPLARKPKITFPRNPHVEARAATPLHHGYGTVEPHFPEVHNVYKFTDWEDVLSTIDEYWLADEKTYGVDKMRAKRAEEKKTLLVAPPEGTLVHRRVKNAESYGVNKLLCPSSDIPYPAVVLQKDNRKAANASTVYKQAKMDMMGAINRLAKDNSGQAKTLVVGDDIVAHLNPEIIEYGEMVKVCGPASVSSALYHLGMYLKDAMKQCPTSFEINRVVWIFSYEYFHRSIVDYQFAGMVTTSLNTMERVFGGAGKYMSDRKRIDHWAKFDADGYSVQPVIVTFVTIPEFGSYKGKFRLINVKLREKVDEYMERRCVETEPIYEVLDWAAAAQGMKTVAERTECLVRLLSSVGVITHVYEVNSPPTQRTKTKKKKL